MSLFARIEDALDGAIGRRCGMPLGFTEAALFKLRAINRDWWNDWRATADPEKCQHKELRWNARSRSYECCHCTFAATERGLLELRRP